MVIPISNKAQSRIVGFGEALLDIIVEDGSIRNAIPGGSVFNTLVSLARCGIPTDFVSDFGDDTAGRMILRFLKEENIGTAYISLFSEGLTALAFAELNKNKDASYTFYKQYPKVRFQGHLPNFDSNDFFAFGSFSALQDDIQFVLQTLISRAKAAGSIVFYDPNIRSKVNKSDQITLDRLKFNFSQADIIRGSNEDFQSIFDTSDSGKIFDLIQPSFCKILIVTSASGNIQFFSPKYRFEQKVTAVKVVSSIGAGDAFNAGILATLFSKGVHLNDLEHCSQEFYLKMIANAEVFAAHVCMSAENYVNRPAVLKIQNLL